MPVLSNMLIDCKDGVAVFLGTDQESLVRVRVPVVNEGTGRMTVPADKMTELVSLLPTDAPASLVDKGGHAIIQSETIEYQLVTLPPDDYPRWKSAPTLSTFSVTQKQLKRVLDAILYALPAKEHRRVLTGSLLEIHDGKLRMTATDGKKLSRMSCEVSDLDGDGVLKTVVPGKVLHDLRRNLGDEGSVKVEVGERQIVLTLDEIEYRTNTIEGKYPDCDAVIPAEFPFEIRLNRDRFQVATRRAGVTSDDKNKSVVLRFHDNSCAFSSAAADVGEFTGDVAVEFEGGPVELAFNYQLAIDTLNSFSHPDIHLKADSQQKPCVFVCDEEPDHLCVLMPIKLSELRRAPEPVE